MSEHTNSHELPRNEQIPELRHTPPPPLVLWVLIGLLVLAVVGSVGAVVVFRSVLLPGQQQRVIDQLPFMRAFLPPTPQGGVLPTALPDSSAISPEDLLGAPLALPTATGVPTTVPVVPAAVEVVPSATPTATLPPTATSVPPTATPYPTEIIPTEAPVSQTGQDGALVAVSAVSSRPSSERMFGIRHVKQTWNNCGPANITMALSFFGWTEDQSVAASFLKPDREDKNVNPGEMVAFVNERTGVRAITRIGGDMNLLKDFIASGFPVIIETGYMPEGYDWIGHYQTVVGYDDILGVFYVYDSYLGTGENGEGIAETYTDFDAKWQHFNRIFIVLYEQAREGLVRDILGDRADLTTAAENALAVAQAEARANPQNSFAWFNIGTALTRLERYEEAAAAYDQARRVGTLPWRMTWYQFGPFEAYYNSGRYDDVLALVNANLNNGAQYVEETHYWNGRVLAAQGNTSGAVAAFRRALQHNPRYADARAALDRLNS